MLIVKRRIIIISSLVILCANSYTQIVFERGYFINGSDQKINCLIRNIDWMNNPTGFQYKLTQDDSVRKADISTVKEFSIIGGSKYVRATVKIDKSSNILEKLSSDRNPFFEEETLFLKLLVEGNASLYKYENEGSLRLFYKKNHSEITQLVYKQYLINEDVAYNFYYKQQLMNEFNISYNVVENVDSEYQSFDLSKGVSIIIGIGYKYKDKYSIEIRKETNRALMHNPSWYSKYSVLSLMFGYTIFKYSNNKSKSSSICNYEKASHHYCLNGNFMRKFLRTNRF